MTSLITKRHLPVYFNDHGPNNMIDISYFNSESFNRLKSNGLHICPLKVVHCASVHYQGRYSKSPSMRFINAFVELYSSLSNQLPVNTSLTLNNTESNEFQSKSTEVTAVGLCVALAKDLFGIRQNRITPIDGTAKRCDFKFQKEGTEFIIESKGRKDQSNISSAISDVFIKKTHYSSQPKYGFVSYLPRSSASSSIQVIDPEITSRFPDRTEEIIKLLAYYSRFALLAGFWRLSGLLNQRIVALRRGAELDQFENRPLEYRNIEKHGISYPIQFRDMTFESFFSSAEQIGFRHEYGDIIAFFSLDKTLITILESQNFSTLLDYELKHPPETISDENSQYWISINDDGTFLCIVNKQSLGAR